MVGAGLTRLTVSGVGLRRWGEWHRTCEGKLIGGEDLHENPDSAAVIHGSWNGQLW